MEPALDVALSCLRNPSLVGATKDWPLPEGMLTLLRLAAGDEVLAGELAQSRHRTPREIIDAAIFFVHQVLFDPAADSYRTLGVRPDAVDAQIKEHYRWLVRWQHPDRAKDVWDGVYADRVNLAWQDLRTPERRRAYDERATRMSLPSESAPTARPAPVRAWHPMDEAPTPGPARWSRFLPSLVLGALALAGAGLIALVWSSRPRGLVANPTHVAAPAEDLAAADRSARIATAAAAEAEAASRTTDASMLAPLDGAVADTLSTAPGSSSGSGPQSVNGSTAQFDELPIRETRAPATESSAFSVPSRPTEPEIASLRVEEPARSAADTTYPSPVSHPNAPAPAARTDRSAGAESGPIATDRGASESVDAAAAPATEIVADIEPIDRLAAEGVLHRLSRAYIAGDLTALMHLFSADARNNRGGIDAISEDYRRLFAESSQRELSLDPSGWMERGDEATLLARYRARVKGNGDLWGDRSDGWIRFELRREDGELKISRMVHERDS